MHTDPELHRAADRVHPKKLDILAVALEVDEVLADDGHDAGKPRTEPDRPREAQSTLARQLEGKGGSFRRARRVEAEPMGHQETCRGPSAAPHGEVLRASSDRAGACLGLDE